MRWNHVATNGWGMLLLGVWLIVAGLQPFLQVTFLNVSLISALLAIAAGVLLLLGR
jgi:hypothetical protein